MEHRVSATELARQLGDILGRVRFRGDSFVIERNGVPVARLVPLPEPGASSVGEALASWRQSAEPDADFADDLERVGQADRQPEAAWD
jgi:prevent-host-death family protein